MCLIIGWLMINWLSNEREKVGLKINYVNDSTLWWSKRVNMKYFHCFLRMTNEVQVLVSELRRITLLWDELWFGTLTQIHQDVVRRLKQLENEVRKVQENVNLTAEEAKAIILKKHHTVLKPVCELSLISRFVILRRSSLIGDVSLRLQCLFWTWKLILTGYGVFEYHGSEFHRFWHWRQQPFKIVIDLLLYCVWHFIIS